MDLSSGRPWFSVEIDATTWLFDLGFLTSNWSCIFGNGCQGVLSEPAPERNEGCCSHGAHLVDDDDRDRVSAAAERLGPSQWHNHGSGVDELFAPDGEQLTTVLVDDVCIFHNPPGFAGGAGCALHLAADTAGERPLDWKPDVCWQVPLRLDEHIDDNGYRTCLLREWRRRDWGDEGRALHWWCTEDPAAHVGSAPVYVEMADEITAMVGEEPYAALVAHLASVERSGETTAVPHPTRRRRTDAPG